MTEEVKKTVDVYPVKKIRRALCYLGDFFISFILTLFIFNFAVFPLTRLTSGYEVKENQSKTEENKQLEILYGNKILFYEGTDKYDFDSNIETTANLFLAYHITYADLLDNVICTYYTNIRDENIISVYSSNDTYGFFSIDVLDSNGIPVLKDVYKKEFAPVLDSSDEMGSQGKKDYEEFISSFFLKDYNDIITDIKSNDLTYEGMSYVSLKESIDANTIFLDKMIVAASYISFAISVLLLYLAFPLFSQNGRTVTMKIMKLEKVTQSNLSILSKPQRLFQLVYYAIAALPQMLFVPYPTLTFTYLFSIGPLLIVSLITLLYVLISMIFLMFSGFSRTLSDFLSGTAYLDSDSLTKIYNAKGYSV